MNFNKITSVFSISFVLLSFNYCTMLSTIEEINKMSTEKTGGSNLEDEDLKQDLQGEKYNSTRSNMSSSKESESDSDDTDDKKEDDK